jgi:hypothetical protein
MAVVILTTDANRAYLPMVKLIDFFLNTLVFRIYPLGFFYDKL